MAIKKILNIFCFAAAICVFGICSQAAGKTAHDGTYYFDKMEEAMIDVLSENQKLINANPDGSVKNKKLLPKAIYKKTYDLFLDFWIFSIYTGAYQPFNDLGLGKTFKAKALKGETDPAKIAPVLTTLLHAGRITIAKAQKDINTEADGTVKLKKFIPAVFGKLTIDRFTEKSGVYMKQTTIGKGEYKARNKYNLPNEWEKEAISEFMTPGWELNKAIGKTAGNEYRYVKPMYITKSCLGCHGKPVGEKGPYGHPKEGYEINDIRGGISVSIQSEP